jgi:nicotinate phosphoribosyltransferase
VTSPGPGLIGSLLDTDLYKLLMARWVLQQHPNVEVDFALVNRTRRVRLAEQLDLDQLRQELERIRALRLSGEEVAALAGVRVGGHEVFPAPFREQLQKLRLPPFQLQVDNGQLQLSFRGPWAAALLWEVPALAVITELRSRAVLRRLSDAEQQRLFEAARTRLDAKLERLAALEGLRLVEFGTRRRFSGAWQEQALLAARQRLGPDLLGTSNLQLALRHGLQPIGTNAHELPMVLAALAGSDAELADAPYRVLQQWQELYAPPLDIVLPDAFGTETFLHRAPAWVARWGGIRLDSGDPQALGEAVIAWWLAHGEDPTAKTLILSDGLDVEAMERLHIQFAGRVRLCFGWGTLLSNDFRGLLPDNALAPLSLVCKAISANGRPTVKLSDTAGKTLGPAAEVVRYRRVFAAGPAAVRVMDV